MCFSLNLDVMLSPAHLLDQFHLSQILQMYLLAKFGGHRSYRNVNSYVNSYMDTLENPALITTIRHIARFLKSEIPIYNSEVPDTAGSENKKKTAGNCKVLCVSRKRNKSLLNVYLLLTLQLENCDIVFHFFDHCFKAFMT